MITKSVYKRVFHLSNGQSVFTGFALDVNDRQYLCTARHCVDLYSDFVYIFYKNKWERQPVQLVDFGSCNADIAVFALKIQLAYKNFDLPPTSGGITYGQDVYFLGFPYGLKFLVKVNEGYPLPLTKKATLSGSSDTKPQIHYLDGINNPGFSGGPVVFRENEDPNNDFKVAAVISGYKPEPNKPHDLNTGIVISHDISHAIDAIKANPIGFDLNKG